MYLFINYKLSVKLTIKISYYVSYMVSFQQDLLLTLNQNHETYIYKYNNLIDDENLLVQLNIGEAEKMILYIKEYKKTIHELNSVIDKIQNIKTNTTLNTKIDNELMAKMIPIMCVYRTLLNEKHRNDINDID